ncbi:MAG: DUF5682 family protein [Kofleriaceae bacterium]|nr:DUF5682 family protein [Kofleriaceae bacterium]
MATLRIIGVRHHSPACARLVRHVIAEAQPWAVLIEGPSDMNARLEELRLPHTLPIAVYSYSLPTGATSHAHGSWAPFCAYSPEWVALTEGLAAGAQVRFIDLPAWDPTFARVENRYSDHEEQVGATLRATALARGFDSTDALWDHLFELTESADELERDLEAYFDGFRGRLRDASAETATSDELREAYMARWIAWALAAAPTDATVLVVCGGFHKPALHALAQTVRAAGEPEVPTPDPAVARTGSYLVPFSFHRLDSFVGYAAGMPSPAFYQALWEHGAAAGERMLFAAIKRLRERGQRVSTADAIAASQLAQGLAQLRSHRVLARTDVLDGLAGALIKDALRAPVPWSTRGTLPAGTDPYLVEILQAFSGTARGALAPGTPRPPLVDDIEHACANVGLVLGDTAATVTLDIFDAEATARRRVLYRLAWLGIPGVELVTAADLRRGKTRRTETWRVRRTDMTTVAMIEAAVYGATLEAAVLARIEEQLRSADGVEELVALVERALRAGFHHLAASLCAAAATAAEHEPVFAKLGGALHRLAALQATEPLPPGHGLGTLVRTAIERALWLLEAIEGPEATFDAATIGGIVAIRAALDLELPELALLADMCTGVWTRRATAREAPPAVRGACVGALWTSAQLAATASGAPVHDYAADAEAAVRGVGNNLLGDLLAGMFALARETFVESDLLAIVDDRLGELDEQAFLVTLPALRRAFAFFPPGERRNLARALLARRGKSTGETHTLLGPVAEPDDVAAARALEQRWFGVAATYGLLREEPV